MEALGATAKASPAKVAEVSDIVCTSLPNSAILKNVILGEDGVLAKLKPGSLVIDLSSVEPQVSRQLSEAAHAKGSAMIDAPVSGGVSGAEAGTLTIMVGGTAE
jgi:3-hydroxyisobutyrate dehydrogenase